MCHWCDTTISANLESVGTTGILPCTLRSVSPGAVKSKVVTILFQYELVIRALLLIKFNSPIHISNIKEEKGVSISAEIENNKYTIGASRICSSDLKHDLFVLENKEIIATIDIEDEIKIGTKSIISSLHSKGYSSFMLSGDKKEKCDKIASQIGIKNIFVEQLPKDKLKTIDKLTQNGTTIMVGDGINDALKMMRIKFYQ